MKTDPISKMSFSSNYLESGRWTKSENPVILDGTGLIPGRGKEVSTPQH
jgi:hypothetical protein